MDTLSPRRLALAGAVGLAFSLPAGAQGPPCRPCVGLELADASAVVELAPDLPALREDERLYVSWPVGPEDESRAAASSLDAAGAVPWPLLRFRTPAPLHQHLAALEAELAAVAELARALPGNTHFQVDWRPTSGSAAVSDRAFLIKRAAVALSGARPDAVVLAGPLPTDPTALRGLYAEEIAAYLDGVVLPASQPTAATNALVLLAELDPGKPVVLAGRPAPEPSELMLAAAARDAAAGFAVTLFGTGHGQPQRWLATLSVLAREFAGDLSFDPGGAPDGAAEAWSFVRGEDLGLRVVIAPRAPGAPVRLDFSDPQLRRPRLVVPGEESRDLFGLETRETGVTLRIDSVAPAFVLRLDRLSAAEIEGIEGVEERLEVTGEREIPVEEILRRLQTFEDAQARRLEHWQATNTTHLRFQGQQTIQTVEVTFRGPWFVDPERGSDWAWRELYVNGVKWRGESIPEIPLIQPEKAAAQPLRILFTKEYRYRLRGVARIADRSCWVVDFEPLDPRAEGNLYRGTVWIDRATSARVRTRAVQLGLEGDVLSNEETIDYRPVRPRGEPAAWGAPDSFVLPLHTLSHQIFSVLNSTLLVESESRLTEVRINAPGFEEARGAVYDSEVTMVRDTERGLRYLVPDPEGAGRIVKEGYEKNRLFAAAGVFADDALDFPLPLGGVDWFSFDFRGTGSQVNVFFAGVLLNASIADPDLLGSRFDGGADLFAIGFPFTETLYRDGEEQESEEVERLPASLSLSLGRPVGNFFKWGLRYRLLRNDFGRTDETDPEFVLPPDHFVHTVGLDTRFTRGGWKLRAEGAWSRRSEWHAWGLPGTGFDPATQEFVTWQLGISRNFHPGGFRRIGIEAEAVGGRDLDRFSKYDFSFFSSPRVHGYQAGKVRAEEAIAAHASYGFELGETFRIDLIGDVARANDEATGLDDELLGGVGVMGTFLGPWQTLVNLDVGVPVTGPEDGFTAYVVFLKLFR